MINWVKTQCNRWTCVLPPWAKFSHFNQLLNDILKQLQRSFMLGDFNVDILQDIETCVNTEYLRNLFSSSRLFTHINMPTRGLTHYNIY